MYVLPHDWAAMTQVLTPLLERVDDGLHDVQLLVLAPDAEAATAVSMTAVELGHARDIRVVAATSSRRATRILRARPPQVLVGTPDTVVELLRAAAVKLDGVRAICIAWIDEIVTRGSAGALENLMAELPKEAARTVVTAEVTPAVEELLERYARRARRELAAVAETDAPVALDYVTTSAHSRLATLRRVLDETDPKSALVFARDAGASGQSRTLLAALGYDADAPIKIGLTAAPSTDLVVLFDLPSSREELRAATGDAKRTIAIIQPRQLSSLRALTAGGPLKPVTMPESGSRARDRDAKVRAELGALLGAGQFGRELLALEPLLEAYDGVEIAAAALQLLERERAARATPETAGAFGSPVQARERSAVEMTRLFVNVGSRDGVRAADLVGAIANQGGAAVGDVGKVDVRESHSTVEVATTVADAVIEKVTGTTIRGRRAVARRDEERPARSGAPRDARGGPPGRGGRGAESGGRGARPTGPRRDREPTARPAGGRPASDRPRRGGERGGGGTERDL
jgi:ATP-dependent RNA helicase DeaD